VTDEAWLLWVERAKVGAAALVAVGVVLEFVGEFAGRPAERRVRAAAEAQIATLENETAQARLELAKLKTPRTLGSDVSKVIGALEPFKGTKFDLYVSGDAESVELMLEVDTVLTKSGWIQSEAMGSDIMVGGKAGAYNSRGIVISIAHAKKAELQSAVGALAVAIRGAGLEIKEVGFQPEFPDFKTNPDAIHIFIGSK
jgi:hypothetical protein